MERYEIEEMRKVLNQRLLLRQLRPSGIGSIIFGALAVLSGAGGMMTNPVDGVLLLLGLFLMGEGIWLLAAPSPRAFVLDGCGLMAVGCWNIVTTILDLIAGSAGGPFLVLGALQVMWGIQCFSKYRQASETLSVTTTQDAINQVDALINTVMKSNFKINPNYFELRQQNFLVSQVWKGVTIGDIVVLAGGQTHEGIIVLKEEFAVRQAGKHRPGKPIRGTLIAGSKKMPMLIAAKSLERLQAWKPDILADTPVLTGV